MAGSGDLHLALVILRNIPSPRLVLHSNVPYQRTCPRRAGRRMEELVADLILEMSPQAARVALPKAVRRLEPDWLLEEVAVGGWEEEATGFVVLEGAGGGDEEVAAAVGGVEDQVAEK